MVGKVTVGRIGHAKQTLVVLHVRAQGLREEYDHLPMVSCKLGFHVQWSPRVPIPHPFAVR